MGSKTKIANEILKLLPSGKRFADLFGGGFAMSHAALLCGKFESVYYNEINALLPKLIKEAIAGKYNYERFKPEFISRERFFAEKESDGYIKYIWSFGNNGRNYLYGRHIEPLKEALHNWVVFGKRSELLDSLVPEIYSEVTASDIKSRRLEVKPFYRKRKERNDLERLQRLQSLEKLERLQSLQSLERLQSLQSLEKLERLQRLEINCGDYRDYKYQAGDVVYCDPPYEGVRQYEKTDKKFDHKEFFNWVETREFPVWFSHYPLEDERFMLVWSKQKRATNGTNNSCLKTECLYANEAAVKAGADV